jgi:hypothetical protein
MKGYITNDWDRDNLNFLLNSSKDTLDDWNSQTDDDDKLYAQELLDAYARELKLEAQFLRVECEMELLGNYPDACRVIQQFRLTK